MTEFTSERMTRFLQTHSARLAYSHTAGRSPTVVFLPGYASNMSGTKAMFLEERCRARGQAFLRLDYQGHGESSGRFEDGTLGQWAADAEAVVESATAGPLLLVGSSMGGWIALLLARRLGGRVAGLVGIAAAPDFGSELWQSFSAAQRATLEADGVLRGPSEYGPEPSMVSLRFIEESRAHEQLHGPIPVSCPVRLLQGTADADVPWHKAVRIAECVESTDVRVTLIKDAAHRLSEPAELALLDETVAALCAAAPVPGSP